MKFTVGLGIYICMKAFFKAESVQCGIVNMMPGEVTISRGVTNLKKGFAYLKLLESSQVREES